ncbi:hypothetical protein GCM10027262_77010 [Nocardia tengchongensis]
MRLLRDTYGNRQTTAPPSTSTKPAPTGGAQSSDSATGAAAALSAAQLYQHNVATAYYNIDSQLALYLKALAGTHTFDYAAVKSLLGQLNTALSALGASAYTPAGQQRVHDIIAAALQQGGTIVAGGQISAADTAAAIDQLTALYLFNIAGHSHAGITSPATTATAQTAISVALSELGKPYVYGATGPDAFDCSGLVQYAAAAAGVALPRTSQEQYRQLPAVNPADIRPGDLIFCEFQSDGPGHVMMYIGNGQCVEAPHTGANVKLVALPSSFTAGRWT